MPTPRRSLLYTPGANTRAMEKARTLDTDVIIFDLEDAVSPDSKDLAREQVVTAISAGGYGYRELVVRANGLDTLWGHADVAASATLPIAAMLFPKVETLDQVQMIEQALDDAGAGTLPIWVMIETPRGILDLRTFAEHARIDALVMGTSDLVKELRARHTETRHNIDYALQHCVMVARHLGKDIFDGVHLDFRNESSFLQVCQGGRDIGFDGKTLIHPGQVARANEVFGYDEAEIDHARRLLAAWEAAVEEGKGVAVLDGNLVENLHADEARRVVAFAQALADRGD